MTENKGVMIFGEVVEGKLASITTELLACGRELAKDLGHELSVVLVGNNVANFAREAVTFGADRVYVVDNTLFKDYQTDSYVPVMEKVVKRVLPQILLMGQTSIGRDLAPRLAFRLNTAVTMGCIDLSIDPASKLMLQTKPVYGGNALAVFTCRSFPQMATVRLKAMAPLPPDASRKGQVIAIEATLDPSAIKTRLLEKVKEEVEGIKLENAKVVIGGGRGIGSAQGFKQLEELAKILKGAVGATRPVCDNGWMPTTSQIGLTGKIISPDLYVAVAVSGASQHMGGCSSAKNIIAINKSPEANIFRQAHFGVVGDWKTILPVFSAKVKELLAG
jgi:electron transfer flavoprotein alpha subunit